MTERTLPQESDAQEIGHRAGTAFSAQMPLTWRPDSLAGGSDVGIDFQIQVIREKRYEHVFRAQLKGSSIDRSSSDKTYFSVPLKVSTAEYLSRVGPVMLIFVDFSAEADPTRAPIYYVWLHELLRERLDEILASGDPQAELTFRVPSSQRLTRALDVCPYLDRELRQQESLRSVSGAIALAAIELPADIATEKLAANIESGGALFVESTLGEADFPWPEPKPGTNAWTLRQLRDAITAGIERDGQELEERVIALNLRDDRERAEANYQRGRLALLRRRNSDALERFASAEALFPTNARYVAARVEATIHVDGSDSAAAKELEALSSSSVVNDPTIVALRARLLIIAKRLAEADSLLASIDPRHSILERILVASVVHDQERVDVLEQETELLEITRQTKLTAKILAARALFWHTFRIASGEMIPPSGPPQLLIELLQHCWSVVSGLAIELKASRWPTNSALLIEVLGVVAVAAGKANEALVLVDDFLRERPQYAELQLLRMRLALHADNPTAALNAVELSPDEPAKPVHEALVSYATGEYHRAIGAIRALIAASPDVDPMYGEALLVAALCASRLFKKPEAEACVARIRELPNGEPIVAVFDFLSRASGNRVTFEAALEKLQGDYAKFSESSIVQDHLITALRPSKDAEAHQALAIADQIQVRRQLSGQEVAHVAQCLNSIGKRRDALATVERARTLTPDDPELASLHALLLDADGETAGALAILERLVSGGSAIAERCRTAYINVATRSGLAGLAVKQFEALLAEASERSERCDIIRGLYALELHGNASSSRLNDLAFSYGALAKQDDEFEEAMYVQLVMTAGLRGDHQPTEEQTREFKARSEKFFETYPESKYVSVIQIPKDADAREFLAIVRRKVGLTEDKLVAFEKMKNELESGALIAPYSWRPRAFLQNVATVSHLWELTKRSSYGSRAYNLLMAPRVRQGNDLRDLRQIPLIDLPTLALLVDLDLWDVLFRVFDRIAISKWTLLRVQTDAGPLGFPSRTVVALRDAIANSIDRIVQPGKIDEEWMNVRDGGLEEAKTIVSDGRFAFYSDDYLARLYVLGDDAAANGLTVVDLIETAERRGYLSVVEAAQRYSRLVRWNVGHAPIFLKHVLAAIPAEVDKYRSADEKSDVLLQDPTFRSLIDAAWSFSKSFNEIADHFTVVIAAIVNENPEVDERLLAAIFSIWFSKAVLRADAPVGDVDLLLAHVTTLIFVKTKNEPEVVRRTWNVYRQIVERHYGERMDEEVERRAIAMLGESLAEAAKRSAGVRANIDALVEKIASGLTHGTADEETFRAGYRNARR